MNNMLRFTKVIFNNQWNLSEEKIGTNFWNTLYTKKLLISDWLRKESSSPVTRVQISNGLWLAEKNKRNQREPIRLELFEQQNSVRKLPRFSANNDLILHARQQNILKIFQNPNTVKSTCFGLNALKMWCYEKNKNRGKWARETKQLLKTDVAEVKKKKKRTTTVKPACKPRQLHMSGI